MPAQMRVHTEAEPLVARRLTNQRIGLGRWQHAAGVVEWLGAVQAQEYQPAKWALGLRMKDARDADVERAIAAGEILRTHVLRPTWHFVAAADLGWMQRLTGPRVHRTLAVYLRKLELETATLTRATAVFERALRDRQYLTRAELAARLRRERIVLSGIRLALVAMHAELEGVICSGPAAGGKFTYALAAERAIEPRNLSGDEALAELTRRFFRSHGPATLRDYVWWSGLLTADAKRGVEIIRAKRHEVDGLAYWTVGSATARRSRHTVHLLPIYDEYLVPYRDRALVPHGPPKVAARQGFVTFQHTLVIDGGVARTWRVSRNGRGAAVAVAVTPLRRLTSRERDGVAAAAVRYERFLGAPVTLTIGR